ncbi:hypothetical protein SLE2022_211750 [Rubroshorea leprosula]
MKSGLEDMKRELDQSDDDEKLLESIAARAVELESEGAKLQHDLINAMSEGEEANVKVGKLKKELGEKRLKIEDLEREIESLKKAKADCEKNEVVGEEDGGFGSKGDGREEQETQGGGGD